ncbi:hypothetical protein K413DRAFT_4728 [Clostridium sp. ASBs410]|nr:hypothetical protein K413DRAFT_4728 [Clostridium sp. ASBs410]
MNDFKTIDTLTKFQEIASKNNVSEDDRDYVRYFPLKIAESILYDLGDAEAIRIANAIMAVAEKS